MPQGAEFRPTTDRVRESLFNILEHSYGITGMRVCDLFAGSGSLGIEAASRGAEHVTFVEKSSKNAAFLKQNLSLLGIRNTTTVCIVSAESYLKRTENPFHILFCDPPYNYSYINELLDTIQKQSVLIDGGLVCYEHSGKTELQVQFPWDVQTVRNYGTTSVTILKMHYERKE